MYLQRSCGFELFSFLERIFKRDAEDWWVIINWQVKVMLMTSAILFLFFLRRKKRRETVNSYSERNPE